jgi:hypothetical protein
LEVCGRRQGGYKVDLFFLKINHLKTGFSNCAKAGFYLLKNHISSHLNKPKKKFGLKAFAILIKFNFERISRQNKGVAVLA